MTPEEKEVCMVADIEGLDDSGLATAYARARGSDRMSSFGDIVSIAFEKYPGISKFLTSSLDLQFFLHKGGLLTGMASLGGTLGYCGCPYSENHFERGIRRRNVFLPRRSHPRSCLHPQFIPYTQRHLHGIKDIYLPQIFIRAPGYSKEALEILSKKKGGKCVFICS